MSKFALGTVQFGLPYGIANKQGQISLEETAAILGYAWAAGVDTLDTAISYGYSERRLGEIGVSQWRVISKLPSLPEITEDAYAWVERSVAGSLERLRIDCLYGMLLHRPHDLLSSQGDVLYAALQKLKDRGWIRKIGVSVYGPEDLSALYGRFEFDLVQVPFNVLDRRLARSGWLSYLLRNGTEVHARSVFLQGLLLMEPDTRPAQFSRWHVIWKRWQRYLADTNLTPLEACLGFALSSPGIKHVLVGVDNLTQLQEILAAAAIDSPFLPDDLCSDDLDLIDPTR